MSEVPGSSEQPEFKARIAAELDIDAISSDWPTADLVEGKADSYASDLHTLHNELHQHSIEQRGIDSLTGLPNEQKFDSTLALEVSPVNQRSSDAPIAVAYFDLDDFKAVNDQFGHDEGDRRLGLFAVCLSEQFRRKDLVARLHGDEFAIILRGVSEERAAELSAKARRKIGKVTGLWGSVGIASAELGLDGITVKRRADQAMLADKQNKVLGHDRPAVRFSQLESEPDLP